MPSVPKERASSSATSDWSTVGAAVLGKDNNPLYIRAFGSHDQLRFHFIVHTALDFVEEKGNADGTPQMFF